MKNENFIHIKLDYPEAVKAKKDILASEVNMLRILRIIKRYHALRTAEMNEKVKLNKKLKDLKANMRKLQVVLPKIKMPKILDKGIHEEEKSEKHEKIEKKIKRVKTESHDTSLEEQIQEIQDRLKALQ